MFMMGIITYFFRCGLRKCICLLAIFRVSHVPLQRVCRCEDYLPPCTPLPGHDAGTALLLLLLLLLLLRLIVDCSVEWSSVRLTSRTSPPSAGGSSSRPVFRFPYLIHRSIAASGCAYSCAGHHDAAHGAAAGPQRRRQHAGAARAACCCCCGGGTVFVIPSQMQMTMGMNAQGPQDMSKVATS